MDKVRIHEKRDPEMVELDRKLEISRSASDLLFVERAREWLLGEGDYTSTGPSEGRPRSSFSTAAS